MGNGKIVGREEVDVIDITQVEEWIGLGEDSGRQFKGSIISIRSNNEPINKDIGSVEPAITGNEQNEQTSLNNIRIKIPDAMGDTIAANGVIKYLRKSMPDQKITIYSNYPELLSCSESRIKIESEPDPGAFVIGLSDYLLLTPHSRPDRKHHVFSMIEVLRDQMKDKYGIVLPEPRGDEWPVLTPNQREKDEAEKFLGTNDLLDQPLPLVWIAPKSSSANRHWYSGSWRQFEEALAGQCIFIELLGPRQRRVLKHSIANRNWILTKAVIMQHCTAGITVDTYAIHLAGAIGFKNVLALLGSSHPDCVLYPGMDAIFKKSEITQCCQPCGNHGYDSGIDVKLELKFGENRCRFSEIKCMSNISVNDVTGIVASNINNYSKAINS